MKIIHSKVDISGSGISIDNKHEPTLAAGSTLQNIVDFLNETRRNLGLVVGTPLSAPSGGSSTAAAPAATSAVASSPPEPAAPKVEKRTGPVYCRQEKAGCLGKKVVWPDRWAEVSPDIGKLVIYENAHNKIELNSIQLKQIQAVETTDRGLVGKDWSFVVVEKGVHMHFSTPNSVERHDWIQALRLATQNNDSQAMKYHPGVIKSGKWTCCGQPVGRSGGCIETSHANK